MYIIPRLGDSFRVYVLRTDVPTGGAFFSIDMQVLTDLLPDERFP
jgi:hypothetical protein